MSDEKTKPIGDQIVLHNAELLINSNDDRQFDEDGTFLTMVNGNSFGGVDIDDSNIDNNSDFIVNMWRRN